VDRVVIVARGQIVATHTRSPLADTLVLDPLHYLATLGRKPGALDHAPVYRDWKLPACFAEFRAKLEEHHGAVAGARRFVRVLQLLADHSLDHGRQAVEACRREHLISAEAVIQRTRTLTACESRTNQQPRWTTELTTAQEVHVPLPDLSRFNQLLDSSASRDDRGNQRLAAAAVEAFGGRPVTMFFT
jgi:hypothetical protein